MAKKVKAKRGRKSPPTDGLGPREKAKLRIAIRQVWHRSYARKLCVDRCIGKGGFSYCEECKRRAPKVTIDHIKRVGEVDNGFIERMMVPSKYLRGLCKECHARKTKEENAKAKRIKDAMKGFL